MVPYFSRDFRSIRGEIVNFIRKNYPNDFASFDDASVGSMLIDALAGVSDSLSFNIDRAFQETQIDFAQERASLMGIARTMGVKVPPRNASVTLCDFSVVLPVKANAPDLSYAPVIVVGAQVVSGGVSFETKDAIDFASPYSQSGYPNRTITPLYNANSTITSYRVTKREVVVNGRTKIFKKYINSVESKPFMEMFLPDADVLGVTGLIVLDGQYQNLPALSQWYAPENQWHEVDSLAQQKIFTAFPDSPTDNDALVVGKWIPTNKRFVTDFTDKGFLRIRFGGGAPPNSPSSYLSNTDPVLSQLDDLSNHYGWGEYPSSNRTVFVKYRVGGGYRSNIGAGTFSVGDATIVVQGASSTTNTSVRSSLSVSSPIPAFGGKDGLSLEEIRNAVAYNYASQNRCVTIPDYYSRLSLIPGKYAAPAKVAVYAEGGFIRVYVLGLDASKKLTNSSISTMKDNILEYLGAYKSPNDYVVVADGKIINLGVEVDLLVSKGADRSQMTVQVINAIYGYFDVSGKEMGEDVYVSSLIELVNSVEGVLNVVDMRFYNKVGGEYSLNKVSLPVDANNRISITNNTLSLNKEEMFEIKYKDKDIKIRFTS